MESWKGILGWVFILGGLGLCLTGVVRNDVNAVVLGLMTGTARWTLNGGQL